MRTIGLYSLCFLGFTAFAEDPKNLELLGDARNLPGPTTTNPALRLTRARVVMANYDLIRRDFPQMAGKTEKEIDAWLLQHAYVSRDQAGQTEFNSDIPVDKEKEKTVTRPREYNRAHVIEAEGESGGKKTYIDVKGVGIEGKKRKHGSVNGDPRNGLLSLGDATREFLMHKVVSGILTEQIPDVRTVNYYAVIDAGFSKKNFGYEEITAEQAKDYPLKPGQSIVDGKDGKKIVVTPGNSDPAALLFRQPHVRFEDPQAKEHANKGHYFLMPEEISLRVEKALRRYGLTSEGDGERGKSSLTGELEGGINIQGGKNKDGWHILDFGNFIFRERFDESRPVTHFYGQRPLLKAGTKDWVQPVPGLMIRADQWGTFNHEPSSKYDNPWIWSHQAGEYIARENALGHDALARGDTDAAERHFANARRAADDHQSAMMKPFHDAAEGRKCVAIEVAIAG